MVTPDPDLDAIAASLDRLRPIPNDVLDELVTRDGLCLWAFPREHIPAMTGEGTADRRLAAALCAGCPVQPECLELDLRTAGPATVGVWGAMTDTDRRALHPLWRARRPQSGPVEGGGHGER